MFVLLVFLLDVLLGVLFLPVYKGALVGEEFIQGTHTVTLTHGIVFFISIFWCSSLPDISSHIRTRLPSIGLESALFQFILHFLRVDKLLLFKVLVLILIKSVVYLYIFLLVFLFLVVLVLHIDTYGFLGY